MARNRNRGSSPQVREQTTLAVGMALGYRSSHVRGTGHPPGCQQLGHGFIPRRCRQLAARSRPDTCRTSPSLHAQGADHGTTHGHGPGVLIPRMRGRALLDRVHDEPRPGFIPACAGTGTDSLEAADLAWFIPEDTESRLADL